MDHGIYITVAGSLVQKKRLECIAYNLANASTPGFKRVTESFEQYLLSAKPTESLDLSQADIEYTGNPLDLAISGEGFFVISTPQGIRYTRRGDFMLNTKGEIATKEGYQVLGTGGPIKVNEGFTVNEKGEVTVNGATVGVLKIVTFPPDNPPVKGPDGYFVAPSGVTPTLSSKYEISQGYLEESNVSVVKEMISLVETLRAFEMCQKLIQSEDEATQKVINEVGSPRG